jgi:hypothetical protein
VKWKRRRLWLLQVGLKGLGSGGISLRNREHSEKILSLGCWSDQFGWWDGSSKTFQVSVAVDESNSKRSYGLFFFLLLSLTWFIWPPQSSINFIPDSSRIQFFFSRVALTGIWLFLKLPTKNDLSKAVHRWGVCGGAFPAVCIPTI